MHVKRYREQNICFGEDWASGDQRKGFGLDLHIILIACPRYKPLVLCCTQARGALPISKADRLFVGNLRDPPNRDSAPPLRELTDENSALCENCASQS